MVIRESMHARHDYVVRRYQGLRERDDVAAASRDGVLGPAVIGGKEPVFPHLRLAALHTRHRWGIPPATSTSQPCSSEAEPSSRKADPRPAALLDPVPRGRRRRSVRRGRSLPPPKGPLGCQTRSAEPRAYSCRHRICRADQKMATPRP
ncbi:hypothetical protein roselon_03520 [Roseibacterium elongatum DSM 19469]|uniref:Uncharacterized protein n=1 Tax=Roseicyclus elongatus DSM 19469 TaxID=1294273 RepID=W8STB7_9RHOB|nr:hypothetical protein roselon_03520 [Roseibacterium elongatum DSM 19469]